MAAGSTLSLGAYYDDGNGLPGNLFFDAGATIDGGVVAAAELVINQILRGGNLFHFAVLVQGTPTVRTISGAWSGSNATLVNATSAATLRAGRQRGAVSGTALPATAGTMGVGQTIPVVAVRFA